MVRLEDSCDRPGNYILICERAGILARNILIRVNDFLNVCASVCCVQEVDDNDYTSENSESDRVDSDFSIDENDELKSDGEGDDQPRRKRKGVDTKAYKVMQWQTSSYLAPKLLFPIHG